MPRFVALVLPLALLAADGAVAASAASATAPSAPGRTEFNLQTATIEDIDKAFDAGALTSERLVQLYLNRIAAYDKQGPNINAIITLQPKALEIARALDAERKAKGPRSKLHGIPVVFKDLFDTKDMPTTAGFLPMRARSPFTMRPSWWSTASRSASMRSRCSMAPGRMRSPARTNYEGQFSYNLYFRRLGPDAPIRNMDELIAKGGALLKPQIAKAYGEFRSLQTNADFIARRDTQESMAALMQDLMKKYRLDAMVYPFRSVPPPKHLEPQVEADNSFSSIAGMPAIVMPAGYTKETNGPIAIEFLGMPFSEPTLFRIAYAFEQGAKLRKLPPTTPALPGEVFTY